MSTRVAIVAPTGYTGLYLIELLLRHPDARLTLLASRRDPPPHIGEVFGQLMGRLPDAVAVCAPIEPGAIGAAADVVFTCLPHVAAMKLVPDLLDAGLRVIDLSADYRLADAALYERTYGEPHRDTLNLGRAAYGLPELFRDEVPAAQLVANPGCYPTAASLAVAPLLRAGLVRPERIVINAASGVTGAGRAPTPATHFPELNESFAAYGAIGGHRHQPEIEQTLTRAAGTATDVLLVPHLLPIDRGILETIYLEPAGDEVTQDDLFEALERACAREPFVRVRNELPNVKHVRDTNYCDLTVRLVEAAGGRRVVLFSAIDNMIKGASGQAVQNMNLMFGHDETAGLL